MNARFAGDVRAHYLSWIRTSANVAAGWEKGIALKRTRKTAAGVFRLMPRTAKGFLLRGTRRLEVNLRLPRALERADAPSIQRAEWHSRSAGAGAR